MQSHYGSPFQAAAPALEYVGVGRRLLALIIDGIILLIIKIVRLSHGTLNRYPKVIDVFTGFNYNGVTDQH